MSAQSTATPTIEAPAASPNDEAIEVRITGLDPGAHVTLEATLVDDEDEVWSSRATFVADETGTVALGDQAPADGDWDVAAPMGWCWAMTGDGDAATATLGKRPAVEVTFRALAADGRETTRTVTRQVYDGALRARSVAGASDLDTDPDTDPGPDTDLVGTLYLPAGDGPHPAVVSLHGSAGRLGPDRTEKVLATRGYATLALDYTGPAEALPDRIREVSLGYVRRAIDWLRNRPAVADGPVGLFGVSRGAELALLVGARNDGVGAVVSYAGSGVAFDTPMGDPAWVDDGEPVPHVSGTGEPDRTDDGEVVTRPVLERGFDEADPARRAAATIPVEEIDGPVLLVSGGDDRVWPARKLSAVAAERLAAADHDFAHLTRDDVGHLIGVPHGPLASFDRGGGSPRATARLGEAAWKQTLDTFERGLGSSARRD